MGKGITRKDFIVKASAGLSGFYVPDFIKRKIFNPEINANQRIIYPLGKCGIMVSRLCFEASLPGNARLLEYAIDNGLNYIDTAHTYGNGNNEKIVGRVITSKRKNIVLSTKIRLVTEELKTGGKKSVSEIRELLQKKTGESLTALKTDYIDILLIHDALDENLLFNDSTMKFFSDMKKSGVIRACGFSANESFLRLTERNNREGFYDVIMIPFNKDYSSFVDIHESARVLSTSSEKGTGIIAMKITGRNSASMNDVKWVLDHKFINSAVIVTDDFGSLREYMSLL